MGILFYGFIGMLTIAVACLVNTRIKAAGAIPERVGTLSGRDGMSCGMTRTEALNAAALFSLFMILTGLAAFRIDVGNDYGNYVNTFHEIYVGGYVVTEPGLNLLVRLLYFLSGGENYLLVFGVFAAATTFLFLKAMYEQSVDFTCAFALFMLLGLYFRTFNTVRYYFVLALTLYGLRYVLKREIGKFILLILFASLFHKSVLVVIPLYLLALLPWKKWQVAVGAVAAVSLPLFRDFWLQIALKLYPSYQNTVYLEKDTGIEGSLMGLIRCGAVGLLCLLTYREAIEKNEANRFYFKLNLLGTGLYLGASFLPLISRIGYYFITAHILLVPGILGALLPGRKKRWMAAATFLFCILYFAYFLLTADQEGVRVLPYHTWVFTEREWLNGSYIF